MWANWNWVIPMLAVGALSDIAGAVRRLARALERRNR